MNDLSPGASVTTPTAGTMLPDVTFDLRVPGEDMGRENPFRWEPTNTAELFGERRVLLLASPGEIRPGCASTLLLDYEKHYGQFLRAGIDEVYCLSVNMAPVVFQWAYSLDIWNVLMLPDGDADFTRGMGMLMPDGIGATGVTTRPYAAIVDDRRIERLFAGGGPACVCRAESCASLGADTLLDWLRRGPVRRAPAPSWSYASC